MAGTAPKSMEFGRGNQLADAQHDRHIPGSGASQGLPGGNTPDSFYRNLLDAAPDAMIVVDATGRIAIVNTEAEKMFGYSRERMLGDGIEMLLPDRYRARHVQHRARYADAPKVRAMGADMELAGLRSNGTEFPVEISLSPIDSASGSFVASVIRDVTERHQIEQALTTARQAAERAQNANTAFLAAASHDLRQPVQALSLLSGALRRTVRDPLALEMIESQQESLDAMTNLLNSLLDISRLDGGAFEPDVEEFPVQRLFNRLASELSRQAKQKKLHFHVEPGDVLIRSDPHLLGEIIQNFVSNAVRYTEQGGVRLFCTQHESDVSITVADTGIGIETDQFENIFKEFHQIKSPSRKREGFGLGLAITHRLADLLGHAISVESTLGEGSSFSIRVPRARAHEKEIPAVEEVVVTGASPTGLIVLVEDDVKVAKAWELLLRTEGYRIAIAESAADARRLAETLHDNIRLIISDYHLADGSNGIDATRILREVLGERIPAFIITGDTSKIVQDAEALENCRIMSKPVSPDVLVRLARSAIEVGQA
jgi:protein-histidine pros-kinase